MLITYAPFIHHVVKLTDIDTNMNGEVFVRGLVDGKPGKTATLTLELAEALKIYRTFKALDIEGTAKAFGIK